MLRRHSYPAFTLIELLIVVVILGILATIVVPQFAGASLSTRENSLKHNLSHLRNQILVFKAQHLDTPPGYPGGDSTSVPTEAELIAQLSTFTSEGCVTSASGSAVYKFGPYLNAIPRNPLNESSAVLMMPNGVPLRAPAADAYGWIYRAETQELIANLTGSDAQGMPYSQY